MSTDNRYKEHKQFMGFVEIETICRNCKQLFLSGNKLHKHLKEECSQKVKTILKEAYSITRLATRATAPALSHAPMPTNVSIMPQDPCNAIPIVESTVPKSNLGFRYAFCNWNYAMVSAALKSNFRSYDKTLFKDHTDTSPPINANWINAREAASSDRNGCMDTGCDAMLINQD